MTSAVFGARFGERADRLDNLVGIVGTLHNLRYIFTLCLPVAIARMDDGVEKDSPHVSGESPNLETALHELESVVKEPLQDESRDGAEGSNKRRHHVDTIWR